MLNQTKERDGYWVLLRDTVRTYPTKINTIYQNNSPERWLRIVKEGDTIKTCIMAPDSFCLEEKSIYFQSKHNCYIGIAFTSSNRGKFGQVAVSDIIYNGKKIPYDRLNIMEFNTIIEGKNYLSEELHTDFKLNKDSETVYLWNYSKELVDSIGYPSLRSNISFGSIQDSMNKFYFEIPSPNSVNYNHLLGITSEPLLSKSSGSYSSPLHIEINHNDNKSKIFYSINGNQPDSINAYKYIGNPIFIDNTTVLKAIAYSENKIPSNIISKTYIMHEKLDLDVFSISADSLDLWGEKDGLLVEENKFVANAIPGYFDFFDSKLNLQYSSGCEIKIHENGAEGSTHKSMRLYARGGLGNNKFKYHFFGNSYSDTFDKLLIRSAGQDWWISFMRDALFSVLAKDFSTINGTEYRPVEVFFNNRYWGLYNLRERVDEEYILEKYNLTDITKVNLIEDYIYSNYGSSKDFIMAYDSIINIENPETKYEIACRHFDIDNFTDYFIIEFYSGNWDWFGNNQKFWSSSEYDGKWRWILNDLDWSIAYGNATRPNNQMLNRAYNLYLEKPEEVKVTSILFNLYKHTDFRNSFLNRCADILNSNLAFDRVSHIVDSLATQIQTAIKHQQQRWPKSCPNWENSIKDIINYAELRPNFLREQFVYYFQLSGTSTVKLLSSSKNAGVIKINSLTINKFPWEGIYFQNIPISITAIPSPGYKFSGWSDTLFRDSSIITELAADFTLIAYFVKDDIQDTDIVINEIMYKSNPDNDSKDWIELYNDSDDDIDISNWVLQDDDDTHKFIFPANSSIKSGEYLVAIKNSEAFTKIYPDVTNFIGDFDFGFGIDDKVMLFNSNNDIIDIVDYSSEFPWTDKTNGTGNSLELINPKLENSIAENWQSSFELYGTPGKRNSLFSNNDYLKLPNIISLSNYPNPFSEATNIVFDLSENSIISLAVYNYLGYKIHDIIDNRYYAKGKHVISFSPNNIPKGLYFCKLTTNSNNKNIMNVLILE